MTLEISFFWHNICQITKYSGWLRIHPCTTCGVTAALMIKLPNAVNSIRVDIKSGLNLVRWQNQALMPWGADHRPPLSAFLQSALLSEADRNAKQMEVFGYQQYQWSRSWNTPDLSKFRFHSYLACKPPWPFNFMWQQSLKKIPN